MPIDKGISYCAFSVSGIHVYPPAVRPRRYPHGTRPPAPREPEAEPDGDAGERGDGTSGVVAKTWSRRGL